MCGIAAIVAWIMGIPSIHHWHIVIKIFLFVKHSLMCYFPGMREAGLKMTPEKRLADHEIVRGIREYSGLTITEVAKLAGINMATLSLFETGKTELSEGARKRLDSVLKQVWKDAEAKRARLNKAVQTSTAFPVSAQYVNAVVGSK